MISRAGQPAGEICKRKGRHPMRFSIIIPVYNVEEYIEKCLQSVENQTFGDYEVIVVDDETPDNSMQIVQRFSDAAPEKYHVIHQKNKGLGGARNTGAAAAQGEYLVFIDSDDYIHPDMLQVLDQRLQEDHSDMLMFNFTEVTTSGEILDEARICQEDTVCRSEEERMPILLCPPAAWNKVYLRSFYQSSGVTFPEKTIYEDIVTRILVAKAQSVQLCTKSFYYYVQRTGSIMNSRISPRVLDVIKMVEMVLDTYQREGLYETFKPYLDASLIESVLHVLDHVNKNDPKNSIQKDLADVLRKHFPQYAENSFLARSRKKKVRYATEYRFDAYHWAGEVQKFKGVLMQLPMARKLYCMLRARS